MDLNGAHETFFNDNLSEDFSKLSCNTLLKPFSDEVLE